MSLEAEMADAFLEMRDGEEMGSVWVINGKDHVGIQGDQTSGKNLVLEGYEAEITFTLDFLKSDFSDLPDENGVVKNKRTSIEYRILRVITSEGDPTVRLECGSLDQ